MQPVISIDSMPSDWGFGNRILYFNNLVQLAAKDFSNRWCCFPWDGYKMFSGEMWTIEKPPTHNLPPCLGEVFFDWNTIPTRDVFKLKIKKYVKGISVAIHFRGTDFHEWNNNAILSGNYYIEAIESIRNRVSNIIIFTDDETLPAFGLVKEHLQKEKISYSLGENTNDRSKYAYDFNTMTECDYIISSPSTFCICAGFIGKEKKIIHNKEWVESRARLKDKFWLDLYNGGNKDYSIWRLI